MIRRILWSGLFVLLTAAAAAGQESVASPSDLPRIARAQPPRQGLADERLRDIFSNYPDRPIESIEIDRTLRPGDTPKDLSGELFAPPGETAEPLPALSYFTWVAPEIWYQSLYFDDVQLERYGQSRCPTLQPVLSGAHFFGTMAIMPYKMGLSGPFEMTSNYGYYRPGSPTPCVGRRLPWEWDAALLQAGAIVGGVVIIP